MFSKLKSIFKNLSKQLSDALSYKAIDERDIEEFCSKIFIDLIEADVAYDVAESIVESIRRNLKGLKIPRSVDTEEYMSEILYRSLHDILSGGVAPDFLETIRNVIAKDSIAKIMFMGINGVGKTTTIAKVAYMLKQSGIRPVIVAADTFRAGAQEQLRKHCEKLGLPFIGGKYGADPAAVAFDGVVYAQKNRFNVVLIDTAGRMHVDVDLMNELKKIVGVIKPHLKILIVDALTGNDSVEQVKRFDEAVGVDSVILTKVDADASGGAALSVIIGVGKPVLYLGIGQGYDDLIRYDPDAILKMLLR
ncbi:MAG: signal recognition particle-docking protein FtsY [Ignisphaera sp.]|nr:signal recognition particle-docking protein FtsY [Ignisphaera sp.]MCX8168320.1 signal recognition particle-docking protein FtsY [Ignisphaera sp.]